eukprot:COSAG01_NODE_8595_length_2725_cov_1.424219_2_plen_241_part_00
MFFALSLPCSHSAAAAAAASAILPLQLSRCVLRANSPRSHRSDAGCAAVFLPFWDSCGWELGSADDYAQVVSMCEATVAAAAQGGDGAAAECACAAGWRGLRCENPTGCDGAPCGAHGTCTASVGSHSCACEDGWSGDACTDKPLLLVAGAGVAAFDGYYKFAGTNDGKAVYCKVSDRGYQIVWRRPGLWVFDHRGETGYTGLAYKVFYSVTSSAAQPPASGWYSYHGQGPLPTPTITWL